MTERKVSVSTVSVIGLGFGRALGIIRTSSGRRGVQASGVAGQRQETRQYFLTPGCSDSPSFSKS